MTTVVVTADLAAEGRRDDRDVVMVGGEQGRWCSMICLGFEDSSQLTLATGAGPPVPGLEMGKYFGSKTVPSLTLPLFSLRSLRSIIWLIFWPGRIEIVRVKNL